jgi:hypothetical protein
VGYGLSGKDSVAGAAIPIVNHRVATGCAPVYGGGVRQYTVRLWIAAHLLCGV